MLERWPSDESLARRVVMPRIWLQAKAAELEGLSASGFEVPTGEGGFGVVASASGLVAVAFPGYRASDLAARVDRLGFSWGVTGRQTAIDAGLELAAYLRGELRELSSRVDYAASSRFVRDVYEALRAVPYGTTVTYGELAALAGHAGKARAVGQAMHRNPTPIFVPCHRVLPSGGGIGGWSGPSGWKARLLRLEGVAPARTPGERPGVDARVDERTLQTGRSGQH